MDDPGVITRYSLPEMAAIWSEERKLSAWHHVETLALEGWATLGMVPIEVVEAVRRAPTPTPEQVRERERLTDHDVAAFVDLLAAGVEQGGEWVHYGLTSSDVADTGQAVILREACDLLLDRLADLFDTVKGRALEHRHTVMIGRTHGIWAEPTTFGLKLATWAFELARDHQRLSRARETMSVGKLSGAVGTYAHLPPAVEDHVCRRLGLSVEPASSQVIHRDRHAELVSTLALVGASIERFATEIRHLQRSEVDEVREPFAPRQKGSSAMPHKRNPILSERMVGLARLLRGYALASLEDVALWHERDISHSSVERVVLPDACLGLHYMLLTFDNLVEGMTIDTERMATNLEGTRGLAFSQAALLAMVEAGMSRDQAYRIVQRNARKAWERGGHLRDLLAADSEAKLTGEQLVACFSAEKFLANAGVVFERLEALKLGDA